MGSARAASSRSGVPGRRYLYSRLPPVTVAGGLLELLELLLSANAGATTLHASNAVIINVAAFCMSASVQYLLLQSQPAMAEMRRLDRNIDHIQRKNLFSID